MLKIPSSLGLAIFLVGSLACVAALALPVVPQSFSVKQPTAARSEPPSGPLHAVVGHTVHTVQPSEILTAYETRSYPGFGGVHVWLLVSTPQGRAWIYGGLATQSQPVPAAIASRR